MAVLDLDPICDALEDHPVLKDPGLRELFEAAESSVILNPHRLSVVRNRMNVLLVAGYRLGLRHGAAGVLED